jgi:hypothetical protein
VCECSWAGSDLGLDSEDDEEEKLVKKNKGVRGWMKRTFTRKGRRATTDGTNRNPVANASFVTGLRRKSE